MLSLLDRRLSTNVSERTVKSLTKNIKDGGRLGVQLELKRQTGQLKTLIPALPVIRVVHTRVENAGIYEITFT
jgi:hypothetical protein